MNDRPDQDATELAGRHKASDALSRDVRKFLKLGGHIQQVPSGAGADQPEWQYGYQNFGAESDKAKKAAARARGTAKGGRK